jgi:hypothetical protein
MWRRSHPVRAAGSLAAGTILGILLGFGRMAAGGHFLSDVVWSGLIAFGAAHVLYYYVLRIPAREDANEIIYPRIERSPRVRAVAIAAAILLCAGILGGGILATPHYKDLAARIRLADYPAAPETIEIRADTLDVELLFADKPSPEIECTGMSTDSVCPPTRSAPHGSTGSSRCRCWNCIRPTAASYSDPRANKLSADRAEPRAIKYRRSARPGAIHETIRNGIAALPGNGEKPKRVRSWRKGSGTSRMR